MIVLAVTASTAMASPAELRLSAGAGAAAAYSDPCGYPNEANCTTERVRIAGAAPMVLVGVRKSAELSERWRWRFGATASALFAANGDGDHASVVTGAGEIGIERGRYAVDMIMGISRLRIDKDEMERDGLTFMTGLSLTGRVTKSFAVFGRLDLHAMMHSPIGGAFAGAGLEWTPR